LVCRYISYRSYFYIGLFALTSCSLPASDVRSSPQAIYPKAPQSVAVPNIEQSCFSGLRLTRSRFTLVADAHFAPGCNKVGTVQLSAVAGDNYLIEVSNIGAVQCSVAKTFNDWIRFGVDRAASQILGSGLARVETLGSFSCRNVEGTQSLSAHAQAGAIDVSAFVLKDGRRIDLRRDWNGGPPSVREFLRVAHSSACKRFGSVLGPNYNAAHADHFHLEGTGPKFCR